MALFQLVMEVPQGIFHRNKFSIDEVKEFKLFIKCIRFVDVT
jgi:hypothetical protein